MPGEKSISFNLVRSFSIASLICVVVTSMVTATVLSRYLENNMLLNDAAVMKQFIERIARHHDPIGYFTAVGQPVRQEELNDFFRDISHMPGVVRINAYSKSRKVIWSNDASLIGHTFDDNHELDEALTGELVIEAEMTGKTEHVDLDPKLLNSKVPLVEIYIPIQNHHNGTVIGVAEIYKVPQTLFESIQAGRFLVWVCVCLGGAFLYFALFWIVKRAGGLIHQQHDALVKTTRMAAIGEMAASVAHSIRNPLASIRSSAELVQDEPGDEVREHSGTIIEQVDRLDAWIRDLLSFSPDSSTGQPRASLKSVVRASLDGFGTAPQQQGIEIQVDLPDALPEVRGDSQLLVQVINSLVANAIEAMPDGGKLTIHGEVRGALVALTIDDTGRGIAADKIKELFLRQVTHKQGGLGVGLSLAKQILQRYGAKIDLQSREGFGTTARLIMPTS